MAKTWFKGLSVKKQNFQGLNLKKPRDGRRLLFYKSSGAKIERKGPFWNYF